MRRRLRRLLAVIPGGLLLASWVRRLAAPVVARARRGQLDELADLVRSVSGRDDAQIAVLGPTLPGLVAAVRRASPGARVTEAPADDTERHLALTAAGPFDVILDRLVEDGRRHRFEETFFQLRAGGSYVVPGGAVELGPRPGLLGRFLAEADAVPDEGLRQRLRTARENCPLAIKRHVARRTVGKALLLSHDIPDVLVKMREPEYNAYLERVDSPHRVLKTIPAQDPPPAPAGSEGPVPRAAKMHRRITRATISLRDYRDVLVAPRQVVTDGRVLMPDTYRHNQWPVLVSTQLVDLAPRFAMPRKAHPTDPPRLVGTYLHLDNEFRGHFGHLLTESLSRVWSWPEALAIDPDAKVLVGATHKRPKPLEYELQLYEACGIPRDRVVVIDGPVRVDRLISGTPMFSHPQYVHPQIAETWGQVGDRLAATATERQWPRRFFVGRRGDKRACGNSEVVEAIFEEYGFEVVYPEDYSLGEQIEMFRAAEVIGGYAGSGLFQIAFVPDPIHVIMVGAMTYTPRNEYLMAAVRGHRVDAVICQPGGKGIQASYLFDVEREGPYLRSILDGLA